MLFRAVFWIGVVALLIPRNSGTGTGPVAGSPNGIPVIDAPATGDLQDMLLARLAAVRNEIEAAERARDASGG